MDTVNLLSQSSPDLTHKFWCLFIKALKYKPEGDPASDDNLRDGVAYLHGKFHAQREGRGDEGAAQQKGEEYGGLCGPHILETDCILSKVSPFCHYDIYMI